MGVLNRGLIEWGVAGRALRGQTSTGDLHLVKVSPTKALVAVVDGLGHGEGAAEAARLAIATLEKADNDSPSDLIQRCHEELHSTRGVVMSLALFHASDDAMTWLGVGNVEGYVLHRNGRDLQAQETLLPQPGVIGSHLPRLSPSVVKAGSGDLLIFATDGIRLGFADNVDPKKSPQQIADEVLARYGREMDDALVLVVRYLGGTGNAKKR